MPEPNRSSVTVCRMSFTSTTWLSLSMLCTVIVYEGTSRYTSRSAYL